MIDWTTTAPALPAAYRAYIKAQETYTRALRTGNRTTIARAEAKLALAVKAWNPGV